MSDDYFFDPRGIDREGKAQLLKEGTYLVKIDGTMTKQKENSMGLTVFFVYQDDKRNKTTLVEYFNLYHENKTTEKIAQTKFCHLLDCIGKGKTPLKNSSDIVDSLVKVEVIIEKHYDQKKSGEMMNKIMKFLPISQIDANLIQNGLLSEKKVSNDFDESDIPF
jgi:hypothetical protein